MKHPFDSNVMLVSTVRNCSKTIKTDYKRIKKALSCFKATITYIVESDSDDDTIKFLSELSNENDGFSYVSLGCLTTKIPNRIDRISYCRNVYMQELNKRNDIDYVIVADLDGINNKISCNSILSCWDSNISWGVCAANQDKLYYDIYALRHPNWVNYDCWVQKKELESSFTNSNSTYLAVESRMIHINKNTSFIEVLSAFGGFAIYNYEALNGCSYTSTDENGKTVCEHVKLHQNIISRGYSIYINPKLINGGWNEHTSHLKLHYWITYTKIGNLLRRLCKYL